MDIRVFTVKLSRIILSATFIISAAAKIFSMRFFDGLVGEQLIGADYADHSTAMFWVQVLTRVIIAGEFMLGVAVLQRSHIKKWVLPAMALLLVGFSLQVAYAASFMGKGYIGGNCGCFGEVIPFDNFQTLIKNGILLFFVWVAYSGFHIRRDMHFGPIVIPLMVGVFTFFTLYLTVETYEDKAEIPKDQIQYSIPTTVQPVDTAVLGNTGSEIDRSKSKKTEQKEESDASISTPKVVKEAVSVVKPEEPVQLKTKSPFASYTKFSNGEVKDLEKGTQIICLFSFSCGHCQDAYRDILEMKKLGVNTGGEYILGFGSEFDEKSFWKKTGGTAPFIRIDKYSNFAKLLDGDNFPKIIVKKNGVTQKTWNYFTYSRESLFNHFGLKAKSANDQTPNGEVLISPGTGTGLDLGEDEEISFPGLGNTPY